MTGRPVVDPIAGFLNVLRLSVLCISIFSYLTRHFLILSSIDGKKVIYSPKCAIVTLYTYEY